MIQSQLHSLRSRQKESNEPQLLSLCSDFAVEVYPNSIHCYDNADLFIARKDGGKYLFGIAAKSISVFDQFNDKCIYNKSTDGLTIVQCPMAHANAKVIRELFEHTRPRLIGIANSFGLGDRIGLANPGHVRAIRNSRFKAVLAQQSIRELTRTNRSPEEVLDAATWAVFQEGYRDGFGADADHLKTTDDIDLMVKAGFTMFTIDPSEHVVNEAAGLSKKELLQHTASVMWDIFNDTLEECVARYNKKSVAIDETFELKPSNKQVLQAIVKYGNVIAHIVRMHNHLKKNYPDHPSELEVSVDETDSPTTLFEHYFIASELKRLGIELVSLAPRFIGDFEKGIDYRGDIQAFTEEYIKHIAIAEKLGPYKMSIHSGSDKFTVYRAIGKVGKGHVHVKTAGTSYLEALWVVAMKEPDLFRSILTFSRENFAKEKETYHVSGKLENVPEAESLENEQLVQLFENDDARQVLHVAFGKVLTVKDNSGTYMFKEKIITCLKNHEELHYRFVENHFRRHIEPFAVELNV